LSLQYITKLTKKKKNSGPVFLFFGEFSQADDPKKKLLANPTNGFLRFKKEHHAPNLDQKNLEVARFRQCVLVGRQK